MTRDPLLEGRSPAISLIWLVKTALLCETLLLNYWSLNITRHLAMIATGQTLVWWSSEIRPTPHKTNHKIWNQKKWKCHFCHCQLMYHKSLWYLHNLPLARVKVLSEVLSDALHTNTMAMVNHNYFLGGFCGICSTGGKNSRAQIYGFLYMCKAIEFWQKGTSLDSTNTYK